MDKKCQANQQGCHLSERIQRIQNVRPKLYKPEWQKDLIYNKLLHMSCCLIQTFRLSGFFSVFTKPKPVQRYFWFCKYTEEAQRVKCLYLTARHVRKFGIDIFVVDLFVIQVYIFIYIYICRKYCCGLLGLISAAMIVGWRLSYIATPNDPRNVVSSNPCQSALTSILVGMRNATVMTHPSRVYI